eukprot:90976_1
MGNNWGGCVSGVDVPSNPNEHDPDVEYALNGEYQKYKLIGKKQYNHDCIIFRFELQTKESVLGMPIGKHMMLKYDDNKVEYPIIRAYTPISSDADIGYFELLIKIYSDGAMTQILSKLSINDYIQCKGPLGSIQYDQPSHLKIMEGMDNYRMIKANKIGMLAGGSGITPMYQIIQHIARNEESDKTQLSLIFANNTEKDILLKDELTQMAQNNTNIKVYHTISKVTSDDSKDEWKGGVGYIDNKMIKEHIYPPGEDVVVMYCGPPPFNKAIKQILIQIGHEAPNILKF